MWQCLPFTALLLTHDISVARLQEIESSNTYVEFMIHPADHKQPLMQRMVQVLHYSEEKIGLSQQIYDYVDQKIQRLDKDLKNFEGDIARERSKLGLAVHCHLPAE